MSSRGSTMGQKAIKVLLIDDDEDEYVLLRQHLADVPHHSYQVTWASTAAEGTTAMAEERYDVCLLDYHIGAHSGLDVLQSTRDMVDRPPIVLVTSSLDREVDYKGMELGATDFLEKDSLSPAMLERAIRYATDRKRTEGELRDASNAADAANRAKSSFLANISHELRTPLNVIIGNSEILRDQDLSRMPAEERAAFLNDIHDNGIFLLELINDLLDLSKAEAGRFELIEEEVVVGEIVENAIALVQHLPYAAALEISQRGDAVKEVLLADGRRIKQVLVNLLNNATKFTAAGGSITVTTEIDQSGDLLLEVADSGVGIAPADLERIMEPFVQVHSGGGALPGTGLGLPLVQTLMELHGGSMSIASDLGVGTRVSVTFPKERRLQRT